MAIREPVPGYSWHPPGSPFKSTHQAVDIGAPAGTPVVAVADGIVRSVGDDGTNPYSLDFSANREGGKGGLMVTVNHYAHTVPARASADVVAQYAHLSAATVRVGQRVRAGDQLGTVGHTGTATGNHLHFGWRVGGVWEDYRRWLPGGDRASWIVQAGKAEPGLPADYGSGDVQEAPRDPFGQPVGAYPLDDGKTCAPGYRAGSVNPQLFGAIPGLWWGRKTFADGTVLACVREDLGPGDYANQTVQDALGTLGDVARNGAFLVIFGVLAILGLWLLVRS